MSTLINDWSGLSKTKILPAPHPNTYSYQGEKGSMGPLGVQEPLGVQGEYSYEPINPDAYIDNMPIREFIHNVPVEVIEESVVKILKKYGLVADVERFQNDATICYPNATICYPDVTLNSYDNMIKPEKTFTLNEVITIINSIPVEMNVNCGGVFEYTQKELLDKKLIIKRYQEKFKNLKI